MRQLPKRWEQRTRFIHKNYFLLFSSSSSSPIQGAVVGRGSNGENRVHATTSMSPSNGQMLSVPFSSSSYSSLLQTIVHNEQGDAGDEKFRFRNVSTLSSGSSDYGGGDDDIDNGEIDIFPYSDSGGMGTMYGRRNGSSRDRLWLDVNTPVADRVETFVHRQLGTLHPLDVTLASVDLIRECGEMASFEGMKFAQEILDRVLEEKHYVNERLTSHHSDASTSSYGHPVVIPERTFRMVMHGWSNLARQVRSAPQRMREVLDMMISEAAYDKEIQRDYDAERRDTEDHDGFADAGSIYEGLSCQPTVEIYNTLLQGLGHASSRSFSAASEAEQVLEKMHQLNRINEWPCKPNTKSFMLVIDAFSRAGHWNSGERAEKVLARMIGYHEEQIQLYQEETGMEYNFVDESANRRRIVSPDTVAFTGVIKAHMFSNKRDAAEKAEALLMEVIGSDHPLLQPDSIIFGTTMQVYGKIVRRKVPAAVRRAAAERAEELLWLMVETFKKRSELSGPVASGSSSSPNASKSSDGANAYGGDATNVSKSHNFQMTTIPFDLCVGIWASSGLPEATSRAEQILARMNDNEFYELTKLKPTTSSYNHLMQSWARNSKFDRTAHEKVKDILHMLQSHETLEPNVQSYTTLMNAYARSKLDDKVQQTKQTFDSLISQIGTGELRAQEMTVVPFTILMTAVTTCPSSVLASEKSSSFSKQNKSEVEVEGSKSLDPFGANSNDTGTGHGNDDDDDDTFTIGLQAYEDLRDDVYNLGLEPDHLTFAQALEMIKNHTNPQSIERQQRVESIMQDAISAGHVSARVIDAVAEACLPFQRPMLQRLLQTKRDPRTFDTVNALPKSWSRNVPPDHRRISFRSGKKNTFPKRGGGVKTSNGNTKKLASGGEETKGEHVDKLSS